MWHNIYIDFLAFILHTNNKLKFSDPDDFAIADDMQLMGGEPYPHPSN